VNAVPAQAGWSRTLRVTQARVILSEWTKLRSIRSTRWSMLVAVVSAVGLPYLFAAITVARWNELGLAEKVTRNALNISHGGVLLAQLAIGVLGVLVITGEYSTGMIRASLGAVPKRLPFLWAKIVVFAVTTLVLMIPSTFLAFSGTQAILGSHKIFSISLSDPGVTRSVLGEAVFLTGVGVLSLALGALVRNTAAGISAFVGIFFVLPPLLFILPENWNQSLSEYLPSSAGSDIYSLTHGAHDLAPWPGFALFCAYIALAVGAAAVMLVRRDA
jgi:ABC-2 type transport system permease protein